MPYKESPDAKQTELGKVKVVCEQCNASYAIQAAKIRGQRFRASCKQCGAIIMARCIDDMSVPIENHIEKEDDPPAVQDREAGFQQENTAIWYVVRQGKPHGPFTAIQIRKSVSARRLNAQTYLWRAGFTQWRRLAEVSDFKNLFSENESPILSHRRPSQDLNVTPVVLLPLATIPLIPPRKAVLPSPSGAPRLADGQYEDPDVQQFSSPVAPYGGVEKQEEDKIETVLASFHSTPTPEAPLATPEVTDLSEPPPSRPWPIEPSFEESSHSPGDPSSSNSHPKAATHVVLPLAEVPFHSKGKIIAPVALGGGLVVLPLAIAFFSLRGVKQRPFHEGLAPTRQVARDIRSARAEGQSQLPPQEERQNNDESLPSLSLSDVQNKRDTSVEHAPDEVPPSQAPPPKKLSSAKRRGVNHADEILAAGAGAKSTSSQISRGRGALPRRPARGKSREASSPNGDDILAAGSRDQRPLLSKPSASNELPSQPRQRHSKPFSASQRSASRAAMQPVPAAVTACL